MDDLKNFTPLAQQTLAFARKEADRFHHNFVGTEHLLLGLIRLGQGVAINVLRKMGFDLQAVRLEVQKQIGSGPDESLSGPIPYTPRVKKVLALAAKEASTLNHTYVGTEHLLLGLLQEPDGVASRVLHGFGVDTDKTRQEILNELDPNYQPPDAETGLAETSRIPVTSGPDPDSIDTTRRYDVYCAERNQEVVYRNALFKGTKKLFPKMPHDILSDFIELEQADGQTIFIARSSIIKFCEHRATTGSGGGPGPKPSPPHSAPAEPA